MSMNSLHDLLVDLLKDTYHAEKQLLKALPKMAKAASTPELREAFEGHLDETHGHVERLEKAFGLLELKPAGKVCHGMMGLIEEGKEVIDEKSDGHPAVIDAALIAAAQKVEHYEITAYGTLATYAQTLGLEDLAGLMSETLGEEEDADQLLTDLATGTINTQAAEADDDESEEQQMTASTGGRRRTAGAGRSSRRR